MGAESLFKELMADNFPNLGERNRHLDPGSIRSTKYNEYKETNTETHYIKLSKIKDKERFLKTAKEKQLVT